MSFDWQTDDHEWDERETRRSGRRPADLPPLNEALFGGPETTAPPSPVAAPRRRRLLSLAAVGVLVVALAALLYWQLQRSAAKAETRLTTEVAASHAAILAAARTGDGELFVSLLSGRDRDWAEAQQWLAHHGDFLDRSAFGLSLSPSAPVSPTVTLAPDLRSAELTLPQRYEIGVGNGLTETVTLQQTAVYRLGPDRWLFAPPDDAFWGETATVGGRYVQVTYPARDADVAEPLARDVDAALAEFCRNLGEECAPLRLVLSTNPASFIAYDRPEGTWTGGSEIVMPTPALFGRPADDAGQRALSRVYSARAVSAAAANFSGWRCCDNALFYGALLDAQLSRLGLQPWPVGAAEYERLAREPELLRAVEELWRREEATAEERRLAYMLVDFIVTQSNIPIPAIQRMLLNDIQMPYWPWISRATNGLYGSQADFERDLLRYAAERGLDSAALR